MLMNPQDNHIPLLSLLVFSPLLGVALILLVSKKNAGLIRNLAFLSSLVTLLLSVWALVFFRMGTANMQYVEWVPWIKEFGIGYHIGVDGISLLLVLLTTVLSSICILSSWTAITQRVKEYMIFMLLLELGMLGVFVSLDMILFYIFWEAMLVPMYFLIGIWGGPRRVYATIKFFLFTMVGSVLMLVAILAMYFVHKDVTGVATFDYTQFMKIVLAPSMQAWLFLAFGLAFAIKVPMFPFHTWLPDAHVEAPTAGSVILAGVLLKMGTYGYLRFAMPLFPSAVHQFMPLMCTLAVIGIVYGALVAMIQPDVKKLVAYSSVSHLGFVMLGLFALNEQGIGGGVLQMINHGFSTGALFLIVGMIYERRHTRLIADFGGVAKAMPMFFVFFLIVTLSSIGLPGTNGFVGEFLILTGTFVAKGNPHHIVYAIVAATGVILAAIYMLWMFQRVMYGPLDKPANQALKDLSFREICVLVPMVFFIFWIGIYSKPYFQVMDASVRKVIADINIRQRASLLVPAGRSAIVMPENLPGAYRE